MYTFLSDAPAPTKSHSTLVSGLSNGNNYTYYVKCNDIYGNINPDDFNISFSVGTLALQCFLTNALFNQTTANEGNSVQLIVDGTNCDGKTIRFEVWEDDDSSFNDPANAIPSSASFISGRATSIWIAEWQNDCSGFCNPPEYYFKAILIQDNSTIDSKSNPLLSTNPNPGKYRAEDTAPKNGFIEITELSKLISDWFVSSSSVEIVYLSMSIAVWKTGNSYMGEEPISVCIDNDNDNYGTGIDLSSCTGSKTQTDCDDNNALINPGKTEVCTGGADDNCNGQTDCFDVNCLSNPICQSDTQAPTQPTNLQATPISSSQINLNWIASTDNVAVTGYRIYRCQGSGCTSFSQISTSPTNSYSNTGLTSSTTYTYKVSAYDAVGNNGLNSSTASTTTLVFQPPQPPGAPVIRYASAKNGPVSGWEGLTTKGAAITIWAENIGSSRGSNTLNVCGVTLNQNSDFAEWGENLEPHTAKNTQRITFWLKPSMLGGSGISVNVDSSTSNTYAFDCDGTGKIYVYPDDASARGWSNLDQATESMKPGDFLYLKGGTYSESWYLGYHSGPSYDGTDAERITFTSYPGEEVFLTGSSLDIQSSYWTVARMTFKGNILYFGAQKDFCTNTNNNERQKNSEIGNDFSGAVTDHAMHNFAHNSLIQGNYVNIIPADTTSYPFYISAGTGTLIKDNEMRGGSKWLIHVFDEDRPNCDDINRILSGVIEDNLLDATNVGSGRDGAVIIQANTAANVESYIVRNNIFYTTDGSTASGNGMLRIRHQVKDIYVYNNIFYNAGGSFIFVTDTGPRNIVIKNNIFDTSSGNDINAGSATSGAVLVSNNLYENTPSLSGVTDSNAIIGNPLFVNPGSDFHLQSTSPAIDAGLTLPEVTEDYEHNSRPQGSGYDIGAYEYV